MSPEERAELEAKHRDEMRELAAELAAALKRIQTLEKALMADRGDWIPPKSCLVWQEHEIAELKTYVRDLKGDNYIWCRAALNELKDFFALYEILGVDPEGRWPTCTLRERVRELVREAKPKGGR